MAVQESVNAITGVGHRCAIDSQEATEAHKNLRSVGTNQTPEQETVDSLQMGQFAEPTSGAFQHARPFDVAFESGDEERNYF